MSRSAALVTAAVAGLLTVAAGALAVTSTFLAAPVVDDGLLVVLAIGSDAGPNRPGDPLEGRADALHLVAVSEDRQHASILDFPRDSYVPVPERGRSRINACLVAGPDRCVETVEALTGIDVDHWFVTDFHGFASAVDLTGGLEIEVEERLRDPFSGTDLRAGRQTLDGGQALAYTRDRKSRSGGDLGRTAAQGRAIRALHAQIVSGAPSVVRIAEHLATLRRTTVTSASPAEVLRLGFLAVRIPPANVRSHQLDGAVGTAGEASVVYLTDRAMATIADVREDGILGGGP